MTPTQSEKAARFRALHQREGAFVIPNPGDAGTARMLAGLPVDAGAALDLGTLYRWARFSSHELTEDDRDQARTALTVLHHDLRAVRR